MKTLKLCFTTSAPPKANRGGYCMPINTAAGGISCTINTRYDGMQLPEDILSLAHYPKTVVLMEYAADG